MFFSGDEIYDDDVTSGIQEPARAAAAPVFPGNTHVIHYTDGTSRAVWVQERAADYVRWEHESGMTGSDPLYFVQRIERIEH